MRAFILCILSLFFFTTTQAQSITITQPNGGEVLYSCQQYTIKWTASGTSNYYNIDYSLNGGGYMDLYSIKPERNQRPICLDST